MCSPPSLPFSLLITCAVAVRGVEDAEAVMDAVVHGVRTALEESGVQRGLYEGHVAEKTAQVQLLKVWYRH